MKIKFISIVVAVFLSTVLNAQIITTVVGNGTGGYSGDGGQATDAWLQGVFGVAVDINGNIYVSDGIHQVIRKVNTLGIISTVAGNGTQGYTGDGGPATAAELSTPDQIATDAAGNIYFADGGDVIRKINTLGIISTIAGNGTQGYTGDGGQATLAQLNGTVGVAVDFIGNVYIGDRDNQVVRKVNTSGIISTIAGNGVAGYNGDGIAATSAELNAPEGITIDAIGNIYIAEYGSGRIRKVNTLGIITTIAGTGIDGYAGNGGPATSAQVDFPHSVLTDTHGNVYITSGSVIQKINTSDTIGVIVGNGLSGSGGDGGPATAAQVGGPMALAFDVTGNLYIADAGNYKVRMVTNVANMAGIKNTIINNSEAKIYPNPSNGFFSIELNMQNSIQNIQIQITDILGNFVKTQEIKNNTESIDITYLAKGVYFYNLIQKQCCIKSGKIIIN